VAAAPAGKKWLQQKVQDAIVDAARSSVADGVVPTVQAALKTAPLDEQGKKAVVKAVEGIIKQRRPLPRRRPMTGPSANRPRAWSRRGRR
jgi:hypothetical protein